MKLIILDRDGVINYDSDEYIKNEDEWIPIPGSLEAIARLHYHGYRIVVATNQAGIARGKFTVGQLNAIHSKMHRELQKVGGVIDAIFFCPHGPDDNCNCRKPKPGLLTRIGEQLHTPLKDVWVIGDKLSDVEAATAAGARPVLVKTGYGQKHVDAGEVPLQVPVYTDLAEATRTILTRADSLW